MQLKRQTFNFEIIVLIITCIHRPIYFFVYFYTRHKSLSEESRVMYHFHSFRSAIGLLWGVSVNNVGNYYTKVGQSSILIRLKRWTIFISGCTSLTRFIYNIPKTKTCFKKVSSSRSTYNVSSLIRTVLQVRWFCWTVYSHTICIHTHIPTHTRRHTDGLVIGAWVRTPVPMPPLFSRANHVTLVAQDWWSYWYGTDCTSR